MLRRLSLSRHSNKIAMVAGLLPAVMTHRSCASACSATLSPDAALLESVMELDTKCSSWTLSQKDIQDVVQHIHNIANGSVKMPDPGPVRKFASDISPVAEHEVVPYLNPAEKEKGVHVPFIMSVLMRCVMAYPKWYTVGAASSSADAAAAAAAHHTPPPSKTQHQVFELRRKNCPDIDLLAAPIGLTSFASTESDTNSRILMLGSSPQALEPFRKEHEEKFGNFVVDTINGYELFQLAQLTIARQQQQQQQQTSSADAKDKLFQFSGLSLDPVGSRQTVIASDAESRIVCQNLACDQALEVSLVLAKWLVEESPETTLNGHKALFVAQCIKNIISSGTYYALQDSKGAVFLFTSMHNLLRYKRFAMRLAVEEWESRGPWSLATTEGANIKWNSEKQPPVINPVVPGDEEAVAFPAFGLQFSQPGIAQMHKIAEQLP